MKSDNSFLKPLESIMEVETPPFLLTRINQKIESLNANRVSPKLAWGLVVSFCLLLLVSILTTNRNFERKHENNLVENLHISTNNDLYQ